MRFVIVPGIDGSDAEHWQSRWQARWGSAASRIDVASWSRPDLDDWRSAIDRAVSVSDEPALLVAHSLGCIATSHWLATSSASISGAFLVAPPDVHVDSFPVEEAGTFVAARIEPLRVRGLLVTSSNDPYCSTAAGLALATAWQVPHVDVGPLAHVNSQSGLGDWDQGFDLLTSFISQLATTD